MLFQDPTHDILVNLDTECMRELLGDLSATKALIAAVVLFQRRRQSVPSKVLWDRGDCVFQKCVFQRLRSLIPSIVIT